MHRLRRSGWGVTVEGHEERRLMLDDANEEMMMVVFEEEGGVVACNFFAFDKKKSQLRVPQLPCRPFEMSRVSLPSWTLNGSPTLTRRSVRHDQADSATPTAYLITSTTTGSCFKERKR